MDFYRALLAEEWLNNMFSSLDGSGWRVNRPFDEGYADERGTVEPIGIGNRLLVRNNDGKPETEIDGFILLDGRHSAILEAKSGVNSYRWGDVIRKMKKIYEVTGARPGFVLAVPSDHLLLSNGWEDERNGFIWRGGMLIVFDAESSDFRDKAESLYLNAKQS
ncbi:MAG: hypothetical protein JXC85_06550 [Candidatus Aenigmarchaeota archaeon]|nr:hypothetical protein [Candidatus Aenigmarchaeota archaeon]